jgi:hypothetical protein
MTYLKKYDGSNDWEEVDYDTAYDTLLTRWRDSDVARDMLTIPNYIECRFADIMVKNGNVVSMPGLRNLVPCDAVYDEETWKRIN